MNASYPDRPIRVLHVLNHLAHGGVETWLMHVLHHIDRKRFHFDFMLRSNRHQLHTDEAKSYGCRIIPGFQPEYSLWKQSQAFLHALKTYGPYDIVHAHIRHFSGYILGLAAIAGVPVRIAHIHSDLSREYAFQTSGVMRAIYRRFMQQCIYQFASRSLAVSQIAALSIFGSKWANNPHQQILYCGIDLKPFHASVIPRAMREELGIAPDTLVVGHVGRFVEQKNHTFLIDILAELVQMRTNTLLLLIGDGTLKPAIQKKVEELHLEKHVSFLGERSDVPRLLLGAVDVLVLPSLFEGLPLTLVEAQAAGLPIVLSDVVARETDVVPSLMVRVGLNESPGAWARHVLALGTQPRSLSQDEALLAIEQSPLNIAMSVSHLMQQYEELLASCKQKSQRGSNDSLD
jgi:glycosyltransferase involved in cell wall biosynthesis